MKYLKRRLLHLGRSTEWFPWNWPTDPAPAWKHPDSSALRVPTARIAVTVRMPEYSIEIADGASEDTIRSTPLAHSPAPPSVVAYVMSDKSFASLPYCRQEACMAQLGLELPRETMADWYIKCAMEYFQPVYNLMRGLLLCREVTHADETACQVLRGLVFFNKLFFIEKGLKGMVPEQRKEKRLEKEAPVWEKFWEWTGTLNPLGSSKLEKAVNYALNHKETLCSYMLGHKDAPSAAEQLLPWSDFIKGHCTGLIDIETITPENKPPHCLYKLFYT